MAIIAGAKDFTLILTFSLKGEGVIRESKGPAPSPAFNCPSLLCMVNYLPTLLAH